MAAQRVSKFIRENYTWDKIAIKMTDVYQKIKGDRKVYFE